MENWASLEEFPPYEVSDQGRVRNGASNYVLGIYDNGHGIMQVVFQRDGKNVARAVHRLVAEAFDGPPGRDLVPMHRNGDRTDNRYDNLEWKHRTFAVKWTRQEKQTVPRDHRRVLHVRTGIVYRNSLECARAIRGLEELVLLTAQAREETTYMGSRFEFVLTNTNPHTSHGF